MFDEPECPGPDCFMCNGTACNLCGAGCWNNGASHCEHDSLERHEDQPGVPPRMLAAISHVRQPTETSCAQACIAMITGVDVHTLIAKMKPGPKSGTRGGAIVRELRDHGVRCGDRFVSLRGRPLPRVAIVRIVHSNKRGHVVVKYERTWFDPMLESPFKGDPPRGPVTPWAGGSRITSALWVGDGMP